MLFYQLYDVKQKYVSGPKYVFTFGLIAVTHEPLELFT
jgi:hypothetical protein